MFPSIQGTRNELAIEAMQEDIKELKTMLGSTNKEEVERRDELPEHVKHAERIRAATANLAGVSVELQLQSQRIKILFEKMDRVEKLYMTLLDKMNQFEKQYVTSLNAMIGGGPTVRE